MQSSSRAKTFFISMPSLFAGMLNTGKCNWGIATQRPDLTRRLNPEIAHKRVINLINAWNHEIKEILLTGSGFSDLYALTTSLDFE